MTFTPPPDYRLILAGEVLCSTDLVKPIHGSLTPLGFRSVGCKVSDPAKNACYPEGYYFRKEEENAQV